MSSGAAMKKPSSQFHEIVSQTVKALLVIIIINSCTTTKYITDTESLEKHRMMKSTRSGNIVATSVLSVGSVILSLILNTEPIFQPTIGSGAFKRVKLKNISQDTLYVNMLSDYELADSIFLDYMGLRIPPQKTCRLLIPHPSNYYIYFSPTTQPGMDEKIEMQSARRRKQVLYPGMTIPLEGDYKKSDN
jgi:hypothetical protein